MTFEITLTILTAIVFLEASFLIFIQISAGRNARRLMMVEKTAEKILEDEGKTHTALIHIGHQMRTIQHDLDILRKNGILKLNSNGYPKAHA